MDRGPALPERAVEDLEARELELRGDLLELVAGKDLLQREAGTADCLGEGVLALGDRLLPALLGEPLADLGPGTRGHDDLQPVAAGAAGGLRGHDLDRLPEESW